VNRAVNWRKEERVIRVTVEYTDDLGPEADVPALLKKLAAKLADGAAADALIRIGARPIVEYVVAENAWGSVSVVVRVDAGKLAAFKAGRFDEIVALTEAHFADLYLRRSIALSFELDQLGREGLVERRHPRPASAEPF
jgi:5-carboxymethyl-2-hydroxymuconate isomerase